MKKKRVDLFAEHVLYDDVIKELSNDLADVDQLIKSYRDSITKIIHDHFLSSGGCERCGGRGWIVAWDTMDSLSGCYAEYNACPNEACNLESRKKTGLDAYYSKYDANSGVKDPISSHPMWYVMTHNLFEQRDQIKNLLDDLIDQSVPRKNDTVIVIKGKKAPVGFVGKIFWEGQNAWGRRLGLKCLENGEEKIAWTYASNVSKIMEKK